MSSRTSTQPKKRKRDSDLSSKSEPVPKKPRRNKRIKLETDCEVNNNISPSDFADVNSENFKKLRDLRVLLDRTVVDNYFRTKLLSKKLKPQKKVKRRSRRCKPSKKINSMENHGQKTLLHFFDLKAVIDQNPTINSKVMLPLASIKQEVEKLSQMAVERVSISMKDLIMLCNVKVNLERLHLIEGLKIENETISSINGDINSSNAIKKFNYYDPEDWIKTEVSDDVSIDESLARIKIEDVSSNFTTTTNEDSMKMEISDDPLNFSEMNFSWNEKCQPSFNELEVERMSKIKLTGVLSAMNNDHLISFYDECPDYPMEEEIDVKKDIVQNVPDALVINLVNSGSSLNSSRHSWPVSDESGIFMSDDSTNSNELSNKFMENSSFDGLVVGNEQTFIK